MRDTCTCIPSGNECHCVRCCLNFSGERAFEMHFGPNGQHLDPDSLVTRSGKRRLKSIERQNPSRVVWVQFDERESPFGSTSGNQEITSQGG